MHRPELDELPDVAYTPSARRSSRNRSNSGLIQFVAVILGGVTAIGLYFTPPVQRFVHALQRVVREDQLAEQLAKQEAEQAARPVEPAAVPVAAPPQRERAGKPIEQIIEEAEQSVLRLEVMRSDGSRGAGSCFVVGEFCLTNYHVIRGAVSVIGHRRDGKRANVAGFIAVLPEKDIAILRLSEPIPPLELATTLPRKGEQAFAIGAPHGVAFSATLGAVNQLVRDGERHLILHQAPISAGNSGGPLVNERGQAIGMNSFMDARGQNMNYAIASVDLLRILTELSDSSLKPIAELPPVEPEQRPDRETGRKLDETRGPKPMPEDKPPAPGPWSIALPSGARIMEDQFAFDAQKIAAVFPKDGKTATFLHPNEKVRALVGHLDRKLHHGMATFHPNGEPHLVGQYTLAQRDGYFQAFAEKGERLLWLEFRKGNRHGISCLFADGRPQLIQEYDKGILVGEFVVEFIDGKAKLTSSVVAPNGAELRGRLEAIEAEAFQFEASMRNELYQWCRAKEKEEFEGTRKERTQEFRQRAAAHAAAVEAAEASARDSLWRAIQRVNTPYRVN